jgi:hypothetical protein
MEKSIKDSLLEFLRLLFLSLVAFMTTEGVTIFVSIFDTLITTEVKLLIIGLLTALFKSVDKYLHTLGKEKETESGSEHPLTLGLTRF